MTIKLGKVVLWSWGTTVENPRHYRKAEKALTKAQKQLSRRKKRSKRWWKAAHLVAKKHQQVRHQRQDFHHKTALTLVRAYDTLYLEDLRVVNLVRNRRLSKSISDAGWAQFRTILAAKAAWAGQARRGAGAMVPVLKREAPCHYAWGACHRSISLI